MRPPTLSDTLSPQTPLVAAACVWLAQELAAASPTPPVERVRELVVSLADAQPAMAAFLSLGTRLLAVADKAALEEAPGTEITARVQAALAAWQADFTQASASVARQAQAVMPASGWVATTTRSSLVERALVLAHEEGRPVHALVSESRPMNEGRGLATSLAGHGIDTWFAVDGTLPLLLPQAGVFLVGADAVRERSIVTKAGTYALLLVARELGLAAYVLAQRVKFLPDRCTRLALPRGPVAEVWAEAPTGVTVVNAPFEEVPMALVRGVVTESGYLGPRESQDAAAVTEVAAELTTGPGPR